MTQQDLINYAISKREAATGNMTFVFNGNTYPYQVIWDMPHVYMAIMAEFENGAGLRGFPFDYDTTTSFATNSSIISKFRSIYNEYQKYLDVYTTVYNQILANTLTTEGQIDTAWTTALGSYSNNRVLQPTNESLSSSITAMQAWVNRTVHTGTSRSIVTSTSGGGFQISSSTVADVSYMISTSTTATIGGASSITVVAEMAPTNSSTPSDWVECGRISNSQTLTLAVALQSVQALTQQLMVNDIPTGYYLRLRSIITGTASATFVTASAREKY